MLPSPYAPGALPSYLAGRGVEIDAVAGRLARVAALNRSGAPLLAFYGPRGLGKTSLLRAGQDHAAEAGFLTAWVTGRSRVAMAPRLADSIAEELRRLSWGERAKQLLQRLEKVQVEVGVPGAKVGVETRPAGPSEIQAALREAAAIARDHAGRGLAVFVDEFQDARVEDRESLLIALQEFDSNRTGAPVAIVAAGLPSMLSAVPEASTFGERTEFRVVGPLTDVAVAEALRLPAEDLGVRWSDDSVLAAIDHAQGYPHHVQVIGDEAWTAARPERGDVITPGHLRQGTEAAAARMATLYESRLAKLPAGQRRFVTAMAELGDGPIRRTDLAARIGVTSKHLSKPRQSLVDRGLVEAADHGRLRFTLPGFAAHVRDRALVEGADHGSA